ncbi:MAG: hypothetical protein VKJ04_09105 [Vampirovibrionales bacterium]|nr:hypothetical protein [Vampirovibrionales bacterium]
MGLVIFGSFDSGINASDLMSAISEKLARARKTWAENNPLGDILTEADYVNVDHFSRLIPTALQAPCMPVSIAGKPQRAIYHPHPLAAGRNPFAYGRQCESALKNTKETDGTMVLRDEPDADILVSGITPKLDGLRVAYRASVTLPIEMSA